MGRIAIIKCSACGGDHGNAEVRRDRSGEYFICFDVNPKKLGLVTRRVLVDRKLKAGARIAIDDVGGPAQ